MTKTYDGTDAASGTATLTSGTLFTNVGSGTRDSLSGGTFAFTNPNAGAGQQNCHRRRRHVSDGNGGG